MGDNRHKQSCVHRSHVHRRITRQPDTSEGISTTESLGQLVVLGFDVAVFTPAPYQRPRLGRPSGSTHLADGFALRCFQRLSEPGADTRRCPWRDNR